MVEFVKSEILITPGNSSQEWRADGFQLRFNWYPSCCNAVILNRFGQSNAQYQTGQKVLQLEEMVEEIQACMQGATDAHKGIMTAITTNKQKVANKALKLCGFVRSKAIKNLKYPNTCLYNWYIALDGYTKIKDL